MGRRELERVRKQVEGIEGLASRGEEFVAKRVARVSGWSIAQQLDHVLIALERSLEKLLSEPERLPFGITWLGRLVLGIGWFPRGSAQAPRGFEGREVAAAELVERAREVAARLAELAGKEAVLGRPDPVLKHPYFGGLNAQQGLRMLAVHTAHHLRIVRDIERASGARKVPGKVPGKVPD